MRHDKLFLQDFTEKVIEYLPKKVFILFFLEKKRLDENSNNQLVGVFSSLEKTIDVFEYIYNNVQKNKLIYYYKYSNYESKMKSLKEKLKTDYYLDIKENGRYLMFTIKEEKIK